MPLVPKPRKVRAVWLAIGALILLLLLLSAFISIERKVVGVCQLRPARQWTLTERRVGSFESKTIDLGSGEILQYRLYQFDRPAYLDVDLSRLSDGGRLISVESGQTVLNMKSSALELELAERNTSLQEARALLMTLRSGAKPEELERAGLSLARAEAELDAFRPQFERQRELVAEGIISDSIWEEANTHFRLLQADCDLAEAELEVLSSDAAPERITATENTILALEHELQTVSEMLSAQEIQTPISGQLKVEPDSGLLLSVSNMDSMIVRMLVPQRQAYLVKAKQEFHMAIPGVRDGSLRGEVLRVDWSTLNTRSGSYIAVYGLIENGNGALGEGMQGRSRIHCGRTTLLRRFRENFFTAIRSEFGPL